MGYDGKAMAMARQVIADRKKENESRLRRRREEAFSHRPELEELEREMTTLMASSALVALKKGGDAAQAIRQVRAESEAISARRRSLLAEMGLPEDWLDDIVFCPVCEDRGYVEGRPCQCLLEEYKKTSVGILSYALDFGEQSFKQFDLSLYEGSSPAETERVRRIMDNLRRLCEDYANNFAPDSQSLLFRGGTGLGKTFLSACIARVVSEKGFSVVYDTAVSVLEAFEAQKFARDEETGANGAEAVRRCLSCDLLILDDLGTELPAGYTQSALYTLINTRLISGGKTIVSTNLTDEELRRRYTPQTVSRLLGEYITLSFVGRDIREVKKERRAR